MPYTKRFHCDKTNFISNKKGTPEGVPLQTNTAKNY